MAGLVGAIDQGIRWGEKVYQLCVSMKHAPRELSERALRAEICWNRISQQMEFSRRVIDAMESTHRDLHHQTLEVVIEKLQAVHRELLNFRSLVHGTNPPENSKISTLNARYALKKNKIDEALNELEKWQATFDVSWLLILKMANQRIDTEMESASVDQEAFLGGSKRLRSSILATGASSAVLLRPDGLTTANITPIPFCGTRFVEKGTDSMILDTLTFSGISRTERTLIVKDVYDLVQRLRGHKQDFGLLQCKGVIRDENKSQEAIDSSFTFVFKVPQSFENPRSLRGALLAAESPDSLSDIIRIGQELAKSIGLVHILGFVHKNIRPETVLLLKKPESQGSATFLVGFQKFRKDGGMTARIGSNHWAENLYSHPGRYGQNPQDNYIMQHDIYSLGVCLLEIGLWESLVNYDDPVGKDAGTPSVTLKSSISNIKDAVSLKKDLISPARTRLPPRVGTRYAEVVETCLTCLDADNTDFGDETEFLDDDGILVAVRYIEKVLARLNEISL